jgi:hypothetical protein
MPQRLPWEIDHRGVRKAKLRLRRRLRTAHDPTAGKTKASASDPDSRGHDD